MIEFRLRYDEHTMLWQYSPDGTRWSEAMRYHKATAAIGREIQRRSIEESEDEFKDLDKRWSMPLPHNAKSHRSDREKQAELMDRYEIRGGRVQRIAASAKEQTQIDASELLAALDGVNLEDLV